MMDPLTKVTKNYRFNCQYYSSRYSYYYLASLVLLASLTLGLCQAPEHRDKYEWLKVAAKELESALTIKKNENVAKNVILFLGDGMGISTITAGRIYKGQQNGVNGEAYKLSFDQFPHTAIIKTYSEDRITADSAATATAYLTGVKTNNGMIGVDGQVKYGQCSRKVETSKVDSILDWALEAGKSVGIVTTTRVTHATPAATYAHVPKRNWECDSNLPKNTPKYCKDIARQLIEDNPNIQVILGGGRSYFMPKIDNDPEYANKTGYRLDNRTLIDEWLMKHKKNSTYVWNMKDFENVDPEKTDYLLGLFEPSHLKYEVDRKEGNDDPNLMMMTDKAIRILRRNPKGFFLLVEGGRIDHGHHRNSAKRALTELSFFDDAVARGVEMTSEEDTLIVVTADHSHVFNIAGYPNRGTDILGKVSNFKPGEGPTDKKPMTILVYGNGPGYQTPRENLTNVNTSANNYQQQSAVLKRDETHGGKDVVAYARGPMSHIFTGVREQNFIAVAMGYSSCVRQGPIKGDKHCVSSASCSLRNFVSLLLATILLHLLWWN